MTPDASLPPADVQRLTPPLTDEELAAMESRVAMATGTFLTSLPWSAEHTEDSDPGYHSGEVHGGHEGEYTILRHELPSVADFVAAAPSDVRRLIADLRSARAEVERLRSAPTICEWGGEFDVPPCDQPAASPIVFFGRPKVWLCQEHFGRGNFLATPEVVQELTAEVERLRAENAEYVAFIATVVRVPNAP